MILKNYEFFFMYVLGKDPQQDLDTDPDPKFLI
jgi:hypothetical protein